jgi:hypothetical protein
VSLPLLPAVYPKNLRFVVPTLLLISIPVLGVGGALTVEGWGFGRRAAGAPVTALFAQFSMFGRPLVAAVGAVVVLAQGYRFYRCHLTTGRYKRWTTHMLLEVQVTYALIYAFGLVLFVLFVVLLLLLAAFGVAPVVGEPVARTGWLAAVVATGVAAKLTFEWSRVNGERRQDVADDSFTANFRPTPPDHADTPHGASPDSAGRSPDP